MATVFFPSCKFTDFSPEASKRMADYMHERFGMTVMGCCRPAHTSLTSDDTVAVVCNTCQAICLEDSPAHVESVWELIRSDDEFPFPNFHGERLALQDCWRSRDRIAEQDAVREVLKRMNVSVVELPENRTSTTFCGTSLYQALPAENARLAPKRFVEHAHGVFTPKSKEEQKRLMEEHCAQIPTEKVVCYCVPCTRGIRLGGKHGMHLADMLFGLDG